MAKIAKPRSFKRYQTLPEGDRGNLKELNAGLCLVILFQLECLLKSNVVKSAACRSPSQASSERCGSIGGCL